MSDVEVFDTRTWQRIGSAPDVQVWPGLRGGVPVIDIELDGALAQKLLTLCEDAAIRWDDQVWKIYAIHTNVDDTASVAAINWEQEMQRVFDAQYGMSRRYVWTVEPVGRRRPRWRIRRTRLREAPTNARIHRTFEDARREVAANVDSATRWKATRCGT